MPRGGGAFFARAFWGAARAGAQCCGANPHGGRQIMARADLLARLVQSGVRNDTVNFRKVVETIIAEERHKQHEGLARNLEGILHSSPSAARHNGNGNGHANGGGFGQTMASDARASNLFFEIQPQRRFSDLVLPREVVEICQNLVQEQHRMDLLRSYNLEPRNRILLIGPPGCGKTSLAEALAEALMVSLHVVRYEGVIGSYLGETANRLRKLIDHAVSRRCVLFFDEFETLGKERGDTRETGEIKRVVSSLLVQVDALPSHVVVVAATNHPELLDRAVWRRFQVRMALPAPSRRSLEEWFAMFERRIGVAFGWTHRTLAEKFARSNYAEVEEFGLSVFREYVLNLPDSDMKAITGRVLKSWNSRSALVAQQPQLGG